MGKRSTARYCSPRCRKAAGRAKASLVPDFMITQPPDVDVQAPGRQVLLPTDDELAGAVLQARAAARTFEAGSHDPGAPAQACARIASAIHGALDAEGLR